MITTLKQTPHPLPVAVTPQPPGPTAWTMPEDRSDGWAPFAIGVLLGLLLILALAAWGYLVASSGDYAHIVDLTRSIAP